MSAAAACRCEGDALHSATVRQQNTFQIVARDDAGEKLPHVAAKDFFVQVRGNGGLVRTKISDNGDGSFAVTYSPESAPPPPPTRGTRHPRSRAHTHARARTHARQTANLRSAK